MVDSYFYYCRHHKNEIAMPWPNKQKTIKQEKKEEKRKNSQTHGKIKTKPTQPNPKPKWKRKKKTEMISNGIFSVVKSEWNKTVPAHFYEHLILLRSNDIDGDCIKTER